MTKVNAISAATIGSEVIAEINCKSGMESRDHSNGVSPKNQRSRGNFLMLGVMALVCLFAVNAYGQCSPPWDGNGTQSDPWKISDNETSGNDVSAYISGSTLYISGSNYMADFWHSEQGESPWWCANRQDEIQTVEFQPGSNVKNIGERAFKDCSKLQTITIPSSVTKINGQSFFKCSSLHILEIPNSVGTIEGEAFRGSGLKKLNIVNGNTGLVFTYSRDNDGIYYYDWFTDCPLEELHLGRNTDYPYVSDMESLFSKMQKLQTLTIGETVTSIKNKTFVGCSNLENVTFQDGTAILYLGNAIGGVYPGCVIFTGSKITTLYIGRDILFYMGSDGILSSFQGNSALEILTIGEKVTAISDYSFYECPNITAITVKNPKPPIIGNGTHKAFEDGIKSTCKRTANNFKVQFKLSKIELEFLEQIVGHLDKKK